MAYKILADEDIDRDLPSAIRTAIKAVESALFAKAEGKLVAPPRFSIAVSLGIQGTGFQARFQLRAAVEAHPFNRIIVYSPTPAHREAFAQEMEGKLGFPIRVVRSAEEREFFLIGTPDRERMVERSPDVSRVRGLRSFALWDWRERRWWWQTTSSCKAVKVDEGLRSAGYLPEDSSFQYASFSSAASRDMISRAWPRASRMRRTAS